MQATYSVVYIYNIAIIYYISKPPVRRLTRYQICTQYDDFSKPPVRRLTQQQQAPGQWLISKPPVRRLTKLYPMSRTFFTFRSREHSFVLL